jgi:Putative phage tail protein
VRAARETISFRLPPSRLDLEPGDTVTLSDAAWRITRITDGASRSCSAVRVEPSIHLGAPRAGRNRRRAAPGLAGPPLAVVLDLAAAESAEPVLQRIAVTAEPWAGGYTLWRSADGVSFEAEAAIATRAMVGAAASALPPGPLWRFDRSSVLDIVLSHGQLQSVSEVASLSGVNLLAVEAPGAGWEIVSFAAADLTGPNSWRLSRLVRGIAGSEALAALAKPVGARVVVLDGAVQPLATGLDMLGRQVFWRLSPAGKDHADAMAIAFETTPGPAALLPLAPVHLKARRQASGVMFSWTRRARTGGEAFDAAEIPLAEDSESYVAEVLEGAAVKRSFAVSTSSLLYPAASEAADFGGSQASIRLRIRQISQAAGPGFAAEAFITIT